MSNPDPEPLAPLEVEPLLSEIRALEGMLHVFEPGETTPARYFQATVQKNLEWARFSLERLCVSLNKYNDNPGLQTRMALSMTTVRVIIETLARYDRRIDEMRLVQGEHVGLNDIFGSRTNGVKKETNGEQLNGTQRFTYHEPPSR